MRPTKFRYSAPVRRPKSAMPFGHDADLALHFDGILRQIDAENFACARRGREQAGEHFDGGGFAGAVGAQKSEELAGSDAQIYVVDGDELAETSREVLG